MTRDKQPEVPIQKQFLLVDICANAPQSVNSSQFVLCSIGLTYSLTDMDLAFTVKKRSLTHWSPCLVTKTPAWEQWKRSTSLYLLYLCLSSLAFFLHCMALPWWWFESNGSEIIKSSACVFYLSAILMCGHEFAQIRITISCKQNTVLIQSYLSKKHIAGPF